MRKFAIIAIGIGLFLCSVGLVSANTIESSTMWFEGSLTYDSGSGAYIGTIAMIDESAAGVGDGIAGFDVYAENGAMATYDQAGSGSQDYATGAVTDNDAYTTAGGWGSFYDPDVADWYHYQIRFTDTNEWYLEYTSGGITYAFPMSGTIDWVSGIATETGTGAYYSGMGTAESLGYAANFATSTGQSTAGAWDMDWSWGSEFIPLENDGKFNVTVTSSTGGYLVSVAPVPEPGLLVLLGIGIFGIFGLKRFLKD